MKRLILILMLLVVSCSQPRLDTSTDEKMKESVGKVRASLSADKQKEFDKALLTVSLKGINFAGLMSGNGGAEAGLNMKKSLHGKSADDVISEADRLLRERAKREKEQALLEITELKQKKEDSEAAKSKLKDFKVIRSKYYIQKQTYGMSQPIIELEVENNTGQPISRAYFEGVVASPGRAVPWIKEDFNYSISGGLEQGEKAKWKLAPNSFSGWGTTKVPKDALLTVDVVRLDDASGESFLQVDSFSSRDAERLDALMKKYPSTPVN